MAVKKSSNKKAKSKAIGTVDKNLEQIESLYQAEREKVKEAIKKNEVEKNKVFLGVLLRKKQLLASKKDYIDKLEKDIKDHITVVDKVLVELQSKQGKEKTTNKKVLDLNKHLKTMQKELAGILKTRKELLSHEQSLVKEQKQLVTKAKKLFNPKEVEDVVETSEERIKTLKEAELMTEQDFKLLSVDDEQLKKINKKSVAKLQDLASKMQTLKQDKVNLLRKLHYLDDQKKERKQELNKTEQSLKELKLKLLASSEEYL